MKYKSFSYNVLSTRQACAGGRWGHDSFGYLAERKVAGAGECAKWELRRWRSREGYWLQLARVLGGMMRIPLERRAEDVRAVELAAWAPGATEVDRRILKYSQQRESAMTWTNFYESDDFCGGAVNYDAATNVPDLGKVKLSNGKSANDQIDSLKLGPNSWLEVFKDANYGGTVARFNPNTIARKLDDFSMGDTIGSFKLYSAEPANWVASTPKSNSTNTTILEINQADVITRFGYLVEDIVKHVPEIGWALNDLLSFLWPDNSAPLKTWQAIAAEVGQMIEAAVTEAEKANMEALLTGLGNILSSYQNTSLYASSKGQLFTELLGTLDRDDPYFCSQEHPQATLGYLVNFATVAIATLREQYLFYPQIYGVRADQLAADPDHAKHLDKLQKAIEKYTTAAKEAATKAMTWRESLVGIQHLPGRGETGYQAFDSFDDWVGQPRSSENDAKNDAAKRVQQVSNDYAGFLNALLHPAELWPYMDPTNGLPPVATQFTVVSGPYGGTSGTAFADAADSRSITKIVIYSGSRVDGIEFFYGGRSGGLHGGASGTPTTLELAAGEYVVAAYGLAGDSMNQLFMRTNQGREVGGGGAGGSSFTALPPSGTAAVLVSISGSQGSDSLESLTLHWAYEKTN